MRESGLHAAELHQPSIVRVSTNLGNINEEQMGLQPQDGARSLRGSRGTRSRGARSRAGRSRAGRSRGGGN